MLYLKCAKHINLVASFMLPTRRVTSKTAISYIILNVPTSYKGQSILWLLSNYRIAHLHKIFNLNKSLKVISIKSNI